MTDDMRLVPFDDELVEGDVVLDDEPIDALSDATFKARTVPTRVASSAESRDWDDQGFDANRYDERPPHWED